MDIDAQKVADCLKACATESYSVCPQCPYKGKCNELIVDAIALLEAGHRF